MFNLKLEKPEDANMAPFEWQQEVTKAASKAWGALAKAEKKPYNDAAAVEAEEHKIKNPGYKYRPKPRKNPAGSKQRKRDDAEVRPKESGHRKKKARRTPLDGNLEHFPSLSLPPSSSLASPRAPALSITPRIGRPDVLDQFNVPSSAGIQYQGTMRGPVPSYPHLITPDEFERPARSVQSFPLPALALPGPSISRPSPLGMAADSSSQYQDLRPFPTIPQVRPSPSFRTQAYILTLLPSLPLLLQMPSGGSQQSISDQFALSADEFGDVAFDSYSESHLQQAAGYIQLPPIPWPTPSLHDSTIWGFPATSIGNNHVSPPTTNTSSASLTPPFAHGCSPAEFTIPNANEQVPSCLAMPLVGANSEAAEFAGLDFHAPFEFGDGRYFDFAFEDIRHW